MLHVEQFVRAYGGILERKELLRVLFRLLDSFGVPERAVTHAITPFTCVLGWLSAGSAWFSVWMAWGSCTVQMWQAFEGAACMIWE